MGGWIVIIYAVEGERINRVRLPILLVVSYTGKINIFPCPRSRLRIWSCETVTLVKIRNDAKRFDIFSPITGGCSEGLGVF